MTARLTDYQIEYILKSPDSSPVVESIIGISAGHIRKVRRDNGYRIKHAGHNRAYINGVRLTGVNFDMKPPPKPKKTKQKEDKSERINSFLYGYHPNHGRLT